MSILNRRKFLKASSVALTGAPFFVKAAQSAGKSYRACVIGHTGRGGYGHGLDLAFQRIPNVSVAGVADPDEKGRLDTARKIGAARSYVDYREMLEKERPDLVAICPFYVERRLEMTQAAAEVGAHIYMEKPIAVSLEEADAIVVAAEKNRIRLTVAHHMRLAPAIVHLKELLDGGLIGQLLEIRTRGKEDSRAGGEDLMILGWHCLYLMRYFAGQPTWCSARVTQAGKEITVQDRRSGTIPLGPIAGDSIHASYAFSNGVQGHFASQKAHGGRESDFQVVLYGAKGVVQIHIGPAPRIYFLADPLWSPGRSGAAWQPLPSAPTSVDPSGLSGQQANNKRLVEDLIRAVEIGGQPVASIYEGRAVLEMVMGVYASHVSGARAVFPLKDRRHPLGTLS
jgi:predicted dehydrogenase